MKRQTRGREERREEETVCEAEQRKRRVSCPSLLLPLCRSPSSTTLFVLPSFIRLRYTGCNGGKKGGERGKGRERRDRDTERERGENGKVLSFFWMSQAQVRRRGRTNRKPGSGRKKKREGGRGEERDRAKERGRGSDDGLAGREHEDPKRGQRENDKGERGGGFDWKGRQRGLFPFTNVFSVLRSARTFRCSCARAHPR